MIRAVSDLSTGRSRPIHAASLRGCEDLHLEVVPCGICGHDTPRRLFTEHYELHGQRFQLGINCCATCGQIYISPRLDRDSVREVYRHDRAHTISHNYCWTDSASDARFQPLLQRLLEICPSGRLLDVGCGNGSFLAAAQCRGVWELTGVEPVAAAAAQAQQRIAAPIHAVSLEGAPLPQGYFDVITLLGVLEHVHDPLELLRQAKQLLRPQGVIAVYVPNFHYLRLKDTGPICWVRRRCWSHLAPQEHLFHFTPHSLRRLMQRSGFVTQRMDVGPPFLRGSGFQRWLKRTAFAAAASLYRTTGIHLGGLEIIARLATEQETSE